MCLLKISPGIFRRSFMLHQILDKCICLLQWQPRCFLRVRPWCDQRETGSKSKMLLFLLLSLLGGWALTGSALSCSLLSCTTPGAASREAARAAGGGGRGRSSGRAPGRQQPQSLHFGCKTKPHCYCNWHCQSGNEDAGGGGVGVCVCAHTKMMLRSLCTAVWGVSVCFCFSWQDRRSSNMNYESLQENTVNKGWDPPVVPWQ